LDDVRDGKAAVVLSELTGSERSNALTKPTVIVLLSAKGLPMATTSCPTFTCVESPIFTGVRRSAGRSTLITARSLSGSAPTSSAGTMLHPQIAQ
jgi:hypothetical protein